MKSIPALALVAGLALAAPASAAVVFFDNFDTYGPNTILNATSADFDNRWIATPGTVDLLVRPDAFSDLCLGDSVDGQGCVDLDGSTGVAATFSTVQMFGPGRYSLNFTIAGNQRGGADDTVTVSFGNVSQTITLPSNGTAFAGQFDPLFSDITVGPGGSVLSFSHEGGDNVGIILKSVTIAAIPVPAAGGLLVAALGALAALRRRKARAA